MADAIIHNGWYHQGQWHPPIKSRGSENYKAATRVNMSSIRTGSLHSNARRHPKATHCAMNGKTKAETIALRLGYKKPQT